MLTSPTLPIQGRRLHLPVLVSVAVTVQESQPAIESTKYGGEVGAVSSSALVDFMNSECPL